MILLLPTGGAQEKKTMIVESKKGIADQVDPREEDSQSTGKRNTSSLAEPRSVKLSHGL